MLSLSYDGKRTDPTIDVLYAPEDQGAVLTLEAETELAANSALRYGIRSYQGRSNSYYRRSADDYLLFCNFSAAF